MFSIERPAGLIHEESERSREELERNLRESEQRIAALQRDLDRAQADAGARRRLEDEARKRLESKAEAAEASRAETRMALAQLKRRAEIEAKRYQNLALKYEHAKATVENLRSALLRTQAEHGAILASLSWRATRPFRSLDRSIPAWIRRSAQKGLKLIWWSITFRLGTRLRQKREFDRFQNLVSESHLFNVGWYLRECPDVAAAGTPPVLHYLKLGGPEGRNPGPEFDARWYLEQYPDVAVAGLNPLVHYLESGRAAGREIRPVQVEQEDQEPEEPELRDEAELLAQSPLFDRNWYYAQYRDIAAANLDPIDHYLRTGAAEGRNPGPNFDGNWYLEQYPDVVAAGNNPLVHYVEHGLAEKREIRPVHERWDADQHWSATLAILDALGDEMSLHEALQIRYRELLPLRTFLIPKASPRLTMVTDSINARSLYGGVGTALILSTLLAERTHGSLRILTRAEPADPASLKRILAVNGIEWHGEVEFLYARPNDERDISVSKDDLFLTTSWWGTRSVLGSVSPERIVYLLQEDERMFYPFGDDRLRCEETLLSPDIRFLVNSRLLFEHLTTGLDALPNVRQNGMFFEPAFPDSHYYPATIHRPPGSKRNFLFYARPRNERNLYWRGLEVIGAAIEDGILSPEDWNFYFVGRSIKAITLPRNINPQMFQDLSWLEYAALVRDIDLGLCLMDTPHPSYPPLDLAASGAVVVTNTRGVKTSLECYSENILTAAPSVEGLRIAIEAGARLACDEELRFANYSRNRFLRSWRTALEPVIRNLASMNQGRVA
jgi:hypothetical protein